MNGLSPLESVGDVIEFSLIVNAIILLIMALVLWFILSILRPFKLKKKQRRAVIFGWFGMLILLLGIVWQQSCQTMHENHHIRKMEHAIMRIKNHHKHHTPQDDF